MHIIKVFKLLALAEKIPQAIKAASADVEKVASDTDLEAKADDLLRAADDFIATLLGDNKAS